LIKINLVPGSRKRAKRSGGGPKMSLGKLFKSGEGGGGGGASMPNLNGGLALMAIGWAAGMGVLGWMFLGGRHNISTLTAQIEAAQLDSVRLESAIKSQQELEARRDIVARKVTIVQDIDAFRYVWAHIHDEVARAVPEYTWLVQIAFMQPDSGAKYPHFSIQGRTGNNFALTKYMQQLEQSPFIRAVELKESQLIREDNKLVYSFLLEADYEPPPPDILETVPLFTNEQADSAAAQPAPQRAAPPRAGAQPNAPAPGKTPAQPNKSGSAPAPTPAQPNKAVPTPAPGKKAPQNPPAKSNPTAGKSGVQEPR
jgi:Tfp pilus assembly protein PilN